MLDNQDYEDKNYLGFRPSPETIEYFLSTEGWLLPYFETAIFIMDIFPVLFMCNILAATQYNRFDEISTEIECINHGFQGYRFVWYEDGKVPVDKVLDFSQFGY